jgi:hypothetical protein
MDMSQENTLYSYLKQTNMLFSFSKTENKKTKQALSGGVDTSGTGEDVGKRCKRVNVVEILCTHVYKWKNETC